MKKQITKMKVFDDDVMHVIKVFQKPEGAPYEVRVNNQFWATCENGLEVNEEIDDIMNLYHYTNFPTITYYPAV